MSDASIDRYENIPTAAVYDTFAETATKLSGRYTRLSDTAASAEERDRWWQMALDLRAARQAVPAHDRTQLITRIGEWEAELARLQGRRRG